MAEYTVSLINGSQSGSGTSKSVTITADSVYQKISSKIMKYSVINSVNISYRASYGINVGNELAISINGSKVVSKSDSDTSISGNQDINTSYFNSKNSNSGKPTGSIVFKLSTITPRTLTLNSASIKYTYTLPTYNISLNMDGQGKSVSGAGTYTVGTTATISAEPKAGHRFNRWSDGNKSNPRDITITKDNITANATNLSYTAIFTPCYDVTTDSNAGGTISGGGQYDAGVSPKVTITPNEGYYISRVIIDGVEQSEIKTEYSFANISSNHTVQVTFEIYKYNVTFTNWNGDTLLTQTVNYGSPATYPNETPTKESTIQYDYSFKSWELTTGDSAYGQKIYADTTYIATFNQTIRQYTISVESYGKGSVSDNRGNVLNVSSTSVTRRSWKYDYGSTVTFTITPSIGYHTIGTSIDEKSQGNITTYTFTNLQADHTFESPFEINKYTVIFKNGSSTLQQEEINHGSTPTYNGNTPTKTSTVEYDYTFSRWNPSITAATQDITYDAVFTATRRKYTITTVSSGSGTVRGAGTYEYGTDITLTAEPNKYCKFYKWSDGEETSSRGLTVQGNKTYTALFRDIIMDADFPSGVVFGFCI